jgi:hypothetical protein
MRLYIGKFGGNIPILVKKILIYHKLNGYNVIILQYISKTIRKNIGAIDSKYSNWRKAAQIANNFWRKAASIANNFWRKAARIAQNIDHDIDPRLSDFSRAGQLHLREHYRDDDGGVTHNVHWTEHMFDAMQGPIL